MRVELPREKSRSGLQDLVRSPELPVFSFEFTNAFSFIGADPGPATGINLRLPDPTPQRFRGHPRLRRDRLNTRPLRAMLALVLEHQGNRTLPELPRIPLRPRHLTDPLKAIGLQQTRGGSHLQDQNQPSQPSSRLSVRRRIERVSSPGPVVQSSHQHPERSRAEPRPDRPTTVRVAVKIYPLMPVRNSSCPDPHAPPTTRTRPKRKDLTQEPQIPLPSVPPPTTGQDHRRGPIQFAAGGRNGAGTR